LSAEPKEGNPDKRGEPNPLPIPRNTQRHKENQRANKAPHRAKHESRDRNTEPEHRPIAEKNDQQAEGNERKTQQKRGNTAKPEKPEREAPNRNSASLFGFFGWLFRYLNSYRLYPEALAPMTCLAV
jgi:hypothetical protein